MSHEPVNPFEPLEPPRGGLAGLRARIALDDAKRTRSRRRWAMVTAAGIPAVLLVTLFVFSLRPQAPMPERFRLARIVAGLEPPPNEPLTISADRGHLVAAQRVPTPSDDVVFYLVGSIQAAPEIPVRDARERATVNPEE